MLSLKSLHEIIVAQLEKEAGIIGNTTPINLYQPIQYTLGMGGKRIRPIMVLMACDVFGGEINKAINAAVAIEIFHNFTLLHDDIMDHADMRRNKEAVHKRYNENVAILSGDAMSIMSYQYLTKTEIPAFQELVQLFSKTAIEVCEGQQYDMDFENTLHVSIDDYLKMIRLKTAVLIACSLKMGALIGGATCKDAEHLYKFGINLGLAFQLQDDLLDVFADQEKFGKKIGGDIVANKKTFLLLKSLELATPEQREKIQYWIEKKDFEADAKIKAIKEIYCETNVKTISENLMDSYYQKAINELNAVSLVNTRKEGLVSLAQTIMKREH